MRFVFGIIWILVGIILMQIFVSENVMYAFASFIDAPSIMMIGLAIGGITIATGQSKTLLAGIKAVFNKNSNLPQEKVAEVVKLFKLLSRTTWAAGAVLFLIAMHGTLRMTGTGYEFLELNLGFLGVYYAVILNLIFFIPAIAILQKH
ncbi:MAG: hypothetical protein FWB98_06985 [Defluviitaleaceae bacterium]|nr:hypothetical protein [Defluviitaleaceae bacterium]